MNRFTAFALRLYPRAWRERYGEEFAALLEQTNGGWRDALNVIRYGIIMQPPVIRAGALGAVGGLLIALGSWGWHDPGYNARIVIPRQAYKVCYKDANHCDPGLFRIGATEALKGEQARLDKKMLTDLIHQYDLYKEERARQPLEAVLKLMRSKITVLQGSEETLQLTFSDPDKSKAERVVRELAALCGHNNQTTLAVDRNSRGTALKPVTLGLMLGAMTGLASITIRKFRTA